MRRFSSSLAVMDPHRYPNSIISLFIWLIFRFISIYLSIFTSSVVTWPLINSNHSIYSTRTWLINSIRYCSHNLTSLNDWRLKQNKKTNKKKRIIVNDGPQYRRFFSRFECYAFLESETTEYGQKKKKKKKRKIPPPPPS